MTLDKTLSLQVKTQMVDQDLALSILETQDYLPVTSIFNSDQADNLYSKEKLLFCYRAVLRTIDSCLAGTYTDFDGHTTYNCCHGMALLARNLITSVIKLDLQQFRYEGLQKVHNLEIDASAPKEPCTWSLPKSLLDITCLYILCFVKEVDPLKGGRTVTTKLKAISPISTNFCNEVAHALKKGFSNYIAISYERYLANLPEGMQISGAPVEMWGKYVTPNYHRTDKRGLIYVSNLYSMQVSLAHLIRSRAKVALINDIRDSLGNIKNRYVVVFEGDGEEDFVMISSTDIDDIDHSEPVVVLGGCVYGDDLDKGSIQARIEEWLDRLPELILSGDVFYPQFFKVIDDAEFNSSPIVPEEKALKELVDGCLSITGVSAADPTLYCSTHYYTASLGQVLKVFNETDEAALPFCFIPGNKFAAVSK